MSSLVRYCPHTDCTWSFEGSQTKWNTYLATHLRVTHKGADPRVASSKEARVALSDPPAEGEGRHDDHRATGATGGSLSAPALSEPEDDRGTVPVGSGSLSAEPPSNESEGFSAALIPSLSLGGELLERPRPRAGRTKPWLQDEIDRAFLYFRQENNRWPLMSDCAAHDYLPGEHRVRLTVGSWQAQWDRMGAGKVPRGLAASRYLGRSGRSHTPTLAPVSAPAPGPSTLADAATALIAAGRLFLDTLERELAA